MSLALFGVFLSSLFLFSSAQCPRVLRAQHTSVTHTRAKSVSLCCVFCSDARARYSPGAAAVGFDEKGKLLAIVVVVVVFYFLLILNLGERKRTPSGGNNRGRGGRKGKQPEIEESEIRLILKKENES